MDSQMSRQFGAMPRHSRSMKPTVRLADRVNWLFRATGSNALRWGADLTYVATWCGFVHVALVVDGYVRWLVGWHASSSLRNELGLDALGSAQDLGR